MWPPLTSHASLAHQQTTWDLAGSKTSFKGKCTVCCAWSRVLGVRLQMHVHVASVQPSLLTVLKQVATYKDMTWVYISCSGSQATNCRCASVALIRLGLLLARSTIDHIKDLCHDCCCTGNASTGKLAVREERKPLSRGCTLHPIKPAAASAATSTCKHHAMTYSCITACCDPLRNRRATLAAPVAMQRAEIAGAVCPHISCQGCSLCLQVFWHDADVHSGHVCSSRRWALGHPPLQHGVRAPSRQRQDR